VRVFIFSLIAIIVVLTFVLNIQENARAFGWRMTVIEVSAAACLAMLLGALAASRI
jgi:hypothetical protein